MKVSQIRLLGQLIIGLKIILLFSLTILLGIFLFKMIYLPFLEERYRQNVIILYEKLKRYADIENINSLYNEGNLLDIELVIEVCLSSNKKIVVNNVNFDLKGDINIRQIGNYRVFSYNSDGSRSPYLPKYVLEKYADLNVDNLIEIINNYNNIYLFVETFDDIEDEKYKNIDKIIIGPWAADFLNVRIYDLKEKQGIFLKRI
jgi:hypothetical protein